MFVYVSNVDKRLSHAQEILSLVAWYGPMVFPLLEYAPGANSEEDELFSQCHRDGSALKKQVPFTSNLDFLA